MELLVIGGTKFVGRAIVKAAVVRGHHVTMFNRGQTNADLFPEVTRIQGDRETDLERLGTRHWDAVIDTCGYVPRVVKASAEYLAPLVRRYVFISTISVYSDQISPHADEDAELATMEDPTREDITGETYGPLKVLCEQEVEAALPGRALIVRPGLIVGPHDPTNRFTYWALRMAQGGDFLAPGGPDYPTQFIDVRDLATWTVEMAQRDASGIYNATGPDYPLTLGALFDQGAGVFNNDANPVWASDEFLLEHEVGPFTEMPLWLPRLIAERMMTIDVGRAVHDGLRFRSLADTLRDTVAWAQPLGDERPGQAGMRPEREAELLQALRG